jgi:hypothetical protein
MQTKYKQLTFPSEESLHQQVFCVKLINSGATIFISYHEFTRKKRSFL